MASCPLCGCTNTQIHPWMIEKTFYRECNKCRFIFLPRPIPSVIYDVYNADYARLRGHDQINSVIHRSKLKTARLYFKKISKYSAVGSLLDIGCSTGANLAQGIAMGWQGYGMDLNEAAVKVARDYIPHAKFFTTLDDPQLQNQRFSLITLFDVIEHIEDLHSFLKTIHGFLKPQGLLFILTPDAHSISARLMRNDWPHLFAEHISLFSKKNLKNLLEIHGFKTLESGFAWKFVSIEGLSRHAACHFKEGHFLNPLEKILNPLKKNELTFPFNIGEFYSIAQKI